MKSTVTMFCILALAVGLVLPVYAEVQNVKVSGDITLRGFYRADYDLTDDTTDDSNAFYTSTVRLRVDADLTDNVSTTVRLLNERNWDSIDTTPTGANNDAEDINIDLAYITLNEFLYYPLAVTLGRQLLRYGSGLVVGDPDTNAADINAAGSFFPADYSARKSFDAIKAVLDYDPVVIDIITAKIDETADTAGANNDTDLYGLNLNWSVWPDNNGYVEGYWFLSNLETGADAVSEVHTLGIRAVGDPIERLNLEGELALQFGDYDDDQTPAADTTTLDQETWALILGGKYTFDTDYEPAVGLRYVYLSGDDDASDSDWETWSPLYEDRIDGEIANALGLNNSNIHIINLAGSIKPTDQIGISLNYYHYTLVEETYLGVDPPGPVGPAATQVGPSGIGAFTLENDEDDLGDEVDIALTYDYSEDVRFGLLFAWFSPGDVFDETNDEEAIEVVASVSVVF